MMGRLMPLIAFLGLGLLLAFGLKNADTKTLIPSPLVGKPAPGFNLPDLHQQQNVLRNADFLGAPVLVNFWASWCITCRVEHPIITQLAATGRIRIVGLNFRDQPADALAWLERFGDPYDVHLSDLDGRVSIDFGVYAAPETFLLDAEGTIVFKHIGALTMEILEHEIYPRLARMGAQGP